MTPFVAEELLPGADVQSDVALLESARDIAQTIYHPVGTCKMGSDEGSVVDERLRVRGVGGLRVVDASIMPAITSGNTNAPNHHDRGEGGGHDSGGYLKAKVRWRGSVSDDQRGL